MLHLKDKTKKKIAGLVDYKDLYIEKILESGDQLLSFSYPKKSKYYFNIEEECYINTKENEFIVKEKNVGSEYTTFKCVLNLEDLEGKPWERYESVEQPIDKALALALAGTGWIVGKCTLKKKRTVRTTNCSSLEVIKNIRKTYRCDLVFNTLTRTIDVYEHLGEDKGAYFIDSLNLKELSIQGNSYDFFTRIIPIGKDDLRITSINGGKEYVENYQYSNKVKTIYWKDDRYTIVENLKEDAEAKLNEISKPYRAYSSKILNLAKLNDKYKDILDYKLGDTITLISKDNKFRDKQRIVKIKEYPDEHELDSVELANTTLTFEELQTQFQEAADTVDNITSDNGTINGETIDSIKTEQISDFETAVSRITDLTAVNAKIHNLEAFNVSITGRLTAVEADIGILNANVGVIDKLTVTHTAQINNLISTKADITDLNAVNATIQVLEAQTAKIETLLNGNLSSENIQAGGITSDKLTIANGFIKNAMIDSLDVSKVNAGDISTNKFKIKSDDGGIEIVGATQQFKDKNNKVRIQMGKDTQGNFNFIIRGEDGTSTLIDHTGVKEKAIADDLIKSNMIASDSVGEKQIDYNSFSKGFNKDTNTTTLKATKIKLDNQNQTLDVAFNQLKTQSDETKSLTESNSTTIGVIQGQISTAINNTQIVKDGQTILLKDDYNRTVATVDSMKSTIGSHTTQIDSATGKINSVETKVNTVERNLNSITARVSSTEANITTIRDTANDANNKIDNLQVGGRNLLKNSKINKTSTDYLISTLYFGEEIPKHNYEYTISIKGNLAPGKIGFGVYNSGGNVRVATLEPSNKDSDGVYRSTFRWIGEHPTHHLSNTHIEIYTLYSSVIGESTIEWVRLDRGNKPILNWTPSPEDTENAINAIDIKISATTNKVAEIVTNLNGITQRVSNTEITTTSLTTQLNQVDGKINTAKNQAIADARGIKDTRNNNESPGWYFGNYPKQSVTEFKYARVVGIPNATDYAYGVVITNVPWQDSSGGYPVQTFRSNSYPTYQRVGVSNDAWGPWKQVEDTEGSQNKANDALNSAKAYTNVEITKTNNKVASIETNLSSITSRVSSVETTNANINGQISNLSARMNTAEQKITDSSIINIVKTSKTNGKNTFVQGTELEQTVSEFNYKFQNVSTINEVDNSNFGNGTQRWQLAKSDNNIPAIIEYSLNYNGGDIACTNSAYIGDCSFDKSVNWVQKIYPKNNRMTQFTLSGCYHYTNVRHGGGVSGPMAHLYMEIYNKDGTVEYYNHANFLDSGVTNVGWKTVHQTYTRSNKAIDYIKLFVYKRNTVGELRITQIDFHEGSIHRKWIPGGNEISNNITTVDANGVKVNSVNTKQFARMDEQFFCVYNNGEAPVNRQAFMGLENGVPTLTLGAHGINPGVQTFGGTHASFKHYAPDKSPLDWGGSWGMLEYKLDSGTSHISRLGFSQAGNIELIPHSATHLYKNVHVHGNSNPGQAWEISASMGFFPTYIKDWSTNAPLRGIKVHSHVIGSDNDNNIYCVSKNGEFSRLHAQIVNMQSARAAYSANISLARVFRDEAQVPVDLGESVEGLALAQKITLERQEEQEEAIICNLLASVEMYEMILETNPGIVNNEKRKSRIAAIYALLIKKDKLSIEDAPTCIVENVRKKLKESF